MAAICSPQQYLKPKFFTASQSSRIGRRKHDFEAAAQRVLALFAGRILPFDSLAAREFASIVADRRRLGRPIDNLDAQIAAITRVRNMSLATRDTQDFADAGVPTINPWQL